ncbi:hypothetical protein EOJ36_04115 [Sandaracinomonas limnophila]|uniref:Uncharacterized protein n=1 Tax=Sandaracinomonas limnophila TaxID=1862386 RepID=A0A437PTN3_9BACT|nr:hypothetical protein [Sandaracinomonas limnophila]RVU25611.1 hypothetical protein EOJ36_04115 [Sandaracinomonas limnophila]
MRYKILIMCMTFYTYFLNAGSFQFTYLDSKSKTFEVFNLQTQQIQTENFTHQVLNTHPFKLVNFSVTDLFSSDNLVVNGFRKNDSEVFFTVPGTGFVFLYNRKEATFTRIDETYYRGYNFLALQFYRKEKLFSLGGSGFWKSNATLTSYDFKKKEWEMVNTYGEVVPDRILVDFAGYDVEKDKIYAIEPGKDYDYSKQDYVRYFELDLKTMQWKYLGNVSTSVLMKYNMALNHLNFLKELFYVIDSYQYGIWIDPVSNEIFRYDGPNKLFFGSVQENYAVGNMIYSYRKGFTKGNDKKMLDSMSVADLRKYSVKISNFYEPQIVPKFWREILILILTLTIGILSFFKFSKSSKNSHTRSSHSTNENDSIWSLFPSGGRSLMEFVHIKGLDYMFTTEEISKILGCDQKAFDTQRQYRSKFITNFNNFYLENFDLHDAIFRVTLDEDKRFVCYQLKPQAFEIFNKEKTE